MSCRPRLSVRELRRRLTAGAVLLSGMFCLAGCAAFHPIHGVPARYLPEEYRGTSRAGKRTIDLSLLKQTRPPAYLVDAGDVLGIYVEGILGDRKLPQPVNIPLTNEGSPSFGFPIPVREDGTISLPIAGAVSVRGLTISEIELRLKEAYLKDKEFLREGNDRILVSLQRPRTYRVLVIRQESANVQPSSIGIFDVGALKRGTGQVVNLPAYRNDVLHALAQTGGLPGLDAENAIYIIRRRKSNSGWTPVPGNALPNLPQTAPAAAKRSSPSERIVRAQSPSGEPAQHHYRSAPPAGRQGSWRYGQTGYGFDSQFTAPSPEVTPLPIEVQNPQPPPAVDPSLAPTPESWLEQPQPELPRMTPEEFGWDMTDTEFDGRRIIKIPVRLGPGETVDLQEQDVILEDGDIVFIESRDTEVFYTGGLLSPGQFTIPRDYDINVLQAIAISQARQGGAIGSRATMSVGGQSALNNDVSISASSLIILRYLPDGRMIPIEIDLYKARTDVAEQVIVQPGDYLMLQYKKPEAIMAFIERHLFEGALFGLAAAQLNTNRN